MASNWAQARQETLPKSTRASKISLGSAPESLRTSSLSIHLRDCRGSPCGRPVVGLNPPRYELPTRGFSVGPTIGGPEYFQQVTHAKTAKSPVNDLQITTYPACRGTKLAQHHMYPEFQAGGHRRTLRPYATLWPSRRPSCSTSRPARRCIVSPLAGYLSGTSLALSRRFHL